MNSVFSAFSCRRLELIHSATPSTQAPRSRHSGAELTGRHQLKLCVVRVLVRAEAVLFNQTDYVSRI